MLAKSLTHHELQQHPELIVDLLRDETDATVVVRREGDRVILLQQKQRPDVDELRAEAERLLRQKEQTGYSREAAFQDLRGALAHLPPEDL